MYFVSHLGVVTTSAYGQEYRGPGTLPQTQILLVMLADAVPCPCFSILIS